jgi:hypothetical protein
MDIDYTRIQDIVPGLPAWQKAHEYYIQYGKDKFIEISDPGPEIGYLAIIVVEWGYQSGNRTGYIIQKNVNRYYKTIEPITL